ncbi:MAG: hypothetical protein VX619_06325 [bacterium]|nr:hypothetical protein [bacterium]
MMDSENKKLDLQIEGMKALVRKLEPFLPRLSPAVLHQYSATEKLLLESLLFRAMRFSVIPGNEIVVSQCIRAIPSHFFLPDPIDLREPYVFVPLIGELLCCVWQLGETKLVTEILGNALSNLKILSEHDQLIFGTRLRLDFSAGAASYMQHPYKVDYAQLSTANTKFDYNFELSKAEF